MEQMHSAMDLVEVNTSSSIWGYTWKKYVIQILPEYMNTHTHTHISLELMWSSFISSLSKGSGYFIHIFNKIQIFDTNSTVTPSAFSY